MTMVISLEVGDLDQQRTTQMYHQRQDSLDCDRRLGDIGRNNDLALDCREEDALLLLARELGVKRHDLDRTKVHAPQCVNRLSDLHDTWIRPANQPMLLYNV